MIVMCGKTQVEIESEEAKAKLSRSICEINRGLLEIDAKSNRALRAIAVGAGTEEDKNILVELESKAAALRVKLSSLTSSEGSAL